MAFVVFKGERKLTDLVARAFGRDLTAAERDRAVAAVERANPHLADLAELPRGSLVLIPPVPGVPRLAGAEGQDDPAADVVRGLADDLEEYRSELREALEREQERVAGVFEILQDDELRTVVGQEPGGEAQLERIGEATEARGESLERSGAVLEQLGATIDELVALADELG